MVWWCTNKARCVCVVQLWRSGRWPVIWAWCAGFTFGPGVSVWPWPLGPGVLMCHVLLCLHTVFTPLLLSQFIYETQLKFSYIHVYNSISNCQSERFRRTYSCRSRPQQQVLMRRYGILILSKYKHLGVAWHRRWGDWRISATDKPNCLVCLKCLHVNGNNKGM